MELNFFELTNHINLQSIKKEKNEKNNIIIGF